MKDESDGVKSASPLLDSVFRGFGVRNSEGWEAGQRERKLEHEERMKRIEQAGRAIRWFIGQVGKIPNIERDIAKKQPLWEDGVAWRNRMRDMRDMKDNPQERQQKVQLIQTFFDKQRRDYPNVNFKKTSLIQVASKKIGVPISTIRDWIKKGYISVPRT